MLGLVIAFNPKLTSDKISVHLLDGNLIRIVKSKAGFGSLIWGRVFGFSIMFALVLLLSLHRWTVLLVFPYAGLQGFTIVMNCYWVVGKHGMIAGVALLLIYSIWLFLSLCIIIMAIVFCIRHCAQVRRGGFRGTMRWSEFGRGCFMFLFAVVLVAVLEWLVYFLVLSRFVFIS